MLSILSSHLGRALWIGGRSSRLEWWVVHAIVSALMKANTDLLIEPSHPTILGTPVPNGLLIGVLNLFALFWIRAPPASCGACAIATSPPGGRSSIPGRSSAGAGA